MSTPARRCRAGRRLAGNFESAVRDHASQHRTGLRDDPATTALDTDMRIGPDTPLHLESASDGGGNKDLSNPHSRWSEALSAFLITSRTARLVKARG